MAGKEEDKEKCRDEAEELVGNKSLCRFIKWSFSHCRLKASGSAYGGGGAEKREEAKQRGALSPQSGDEALEMNILNLFQTVALNPCFLYTMENIVIYRYIDQPIIWIKKLISEWLQSKWSLNNLFQTNQSDDSGSSTIYTMHNIS